MKRIRCFIKLVLYYIRYELFSKLRRKIVKCPVCGHYTLDEYYICPYCKWEYDPFVENEDDKSYPNGNLSIKEYRKVEIK